MSCRYSELENYCEYLEEKIKKYEKVIKMVCCDGCCGEKDCNCAENKILPPERCEKCKEKDSCSCDLKKQIEE